MSVYGGPTLKPRKIVKPILRKFSPSEKNSLDLDRSAEQQQDALGIFEYGIVSRDVAVFSPTPTLRRSVGGVAGGGGGGGIGGAKYHIRSTSGTSQFSNATAGSGPRAGSFVHPFQQTPRPYTPPLSITSHQNSLRDSDHNLSPAEDEADFRLNFRPSSNLSSHRSPSLTPTSSSPAILTQPLRIQTKPSYSRLALAASNSSLHSNTNTNNAIISDFVSPSETLSPASAIRSSMDKSFHIRGRSESIQEARRKFREKEKAQEEKAAREDIKQLEKRQQKEAIKIERSHRRSSASDATRGKRSKLDFTLAEKIDDGRDVVDISGPEGLIGREYTTSTAHRQSNFPEDGPQPRRSGLAKQKTHSAWTKFVMWFRTRLIRLSNKTSSSSKL